MLTPQAQSDIGRTREGEVVQRIIMVVNGRYLPVFPAVAVAEHLGYKMRYINHLCDIGKLNAFFAFGHWWVAEKSVLAYPEQVLWSDCYMVI